MGCVKFYQKGEMSKDAFIKKMREISGDFSTLVSQLQPNSSQEQSTQNDKKRKPESDEPEEELEGAKIPRTEGMSG